MKISSILSLDIEIGGSTNRLTERSTTTATSATDTRQAAICQKNYCRDLTF